MGDVALAIPMLSPLLLLACTGYGAPDSVLLDTPATESWVVEGLRCPAHVVRTEAGVPHIYAWDRADSARVQGFVVARDRYFMIEVARRLGLGTVSALLGQDALETDMESRGTGMTWVADALSSRLTDTEAELFDAFAAGVSDYVEAVRVGELPVPSELEVFGPVLGFEDPSELLEPWERRDVAGMAAVIVYELGYETGDVKRQETADRLVDFYAGAALEDLREAGLQVDIAARVDPVHPLSSAPGWGLNGSGATGSRSGRSRASDREVDLPLALLERATSRLSRIEHRLGHDHENGWGSNAWAVTADAADGGSLLAGGGHLPLSVPSLFYQMGLDTALLGGGDLTQLGLFIPGLPVMAVGTNGHVAWSQTQIMGDITDWYAEELQLDDSGIPVRSLFQGEWRDLVAHSETYEIAAVPLLDSVGRSETWTRWTTFDGRWITSIEGRDASPDDVLAEGETLVALLGDHVVPEDLDGDGVISAISFDYTGTDAANLLGPVDAFGHARSVEELRQATRDLVAYSQNIIASDADGSVLYTGFQAVPCRLDLAREPDGTWAEGANPARLLDGTTYGAFEVRLEDGALVEDASDAAGCVVPFDDYPQSIDPDEGFVITANHDIGGLTLDNDLLDEPWWIGGPWVAGFRANSIHQGLTELVSSGTADVEAMQALQGDHHSALGEVLLSTLLDAISAARQASDDGLAGEDSRSGRLAELYESDAAALDEVADRLADWRASGVETFYDAPTDQDVTDAAATMIFNAWSTRFVRQVLDDEGLPSVWQPTGRAGRERTLLLMLEGRGPDNSTGLASWNPETEESAYFDVLGTEGIETSEEVALTATLDALTFLRSSPSDDGEGGFGSEDMGSWLWGYRHWVHFDSVLEELLGGDEYSGLISQFSITPRQLPLMPGVPPTDPRDDMPGFPRPGDSHAVDAANFSGSGSSFDYGSGPVFRMVIRLGPDGVTGENILPGGQSGLTDSEHFSDQAELWLANQTLPMWFEVEDVVANATGREVYAPPTYSAECH